MANNSSEKTLLESIIEAHGGLDRWQRVEKVVCKYNFHGAVLQLKGYPENYVPTATVAREGEPMTVLKNFIPGSINVWYFTPSRVWMESSEGDLLQERHEPRSSFQGHSRKTPWDDLHLLYFIGYANYNYLTIPWLFTYPGFESRELEPHTESGETWRVLQVTHPDGFATHCKVQKFYFGSEDFLLKRMDYVAEVLNGHAGHYVFDYKNIDGLLFPTVRRVVRRVDGQPKLASQTSFWLDYVDLKVIDNDGTVHTKANRVFT